MGLPKTVENRALESGLAVRAESLTLPVFREIAALAQKTGAINLGGGTPDFPSPSEVKEAAIEAIAADCNQYSLSQGALELRRKIAERIQTKYQETFDPEQEITVCCGATEGVAASLLALVNPGDEVLIFEPAFTIYGPDVILCGGKPVYVPLEAPDFRIERGAIEAVLSPKTKVIILNSPHNPTGRIFAVEELKIIADICLQHNIIALTDEIYDEITFDGEQPAKL